MVKKYLLLILVFFISLECFSAVSVTPPEPYLLKDKVIYYSSFNSYTAVEMDTGFTNFDLTKTQFGGAYGTTVDSVGYPNILWFDVKSDKTFKEESGKKLVVTVMAKVASGESKPVPIAAVNNGPCNIDENCQGYIDIIPSGSTQTYRYARSARYASGSTLKIGIYPSDICTVLNSQAVTASGCNGLTVTQPSVTPTQMGLTFYVSLAADAVAVGETNSEQEKSDEITLSFHGIKPYYACESDKLDTIYFPGDSEIKVETQNIAVNAIAGSAPVNTLLFVGNVDASAITGQDVLASNSYVGRVPFNSGTQSLKGFTNTSTGNDNNYQLAIFARDSAGAIADYSEGCQLNNVQTSQIQGFVQNGNCFIATAAFRSQEQIPVLWLRKFRDIVLLKTSIGSQFVKFYYQYSPLYAHGLVKHSTLRIPVLGLLIPLQITAFLVTQFVTNPIFFLIWILTTLFILVSILKFREKIWSKFKCVNYIKKTTVLLVILLFWNQTVFSNENSSQSYSASLKEDLIEQDKKKNEGTTEVEVSYSKKLQKELKSKKESSDQETHSEQSYTKIVKENFKSPEEASSAGYSKSIQSKIEPIPPSEQSAIQAVQEGRSELKAKKIGEIHHAAGLRLVGTGMRDLTSGDKHFSDLYGNKWVPEFAGFYEYQLFHSEWVGSIGIVFSGSFAQFYGDGKFDRELLNARTGQTFGLESKTNFNLVSVPLQLGVNYRFNLFRILRPFAQFLPTVYLFNETRSDGVPSKRGYSTALGVSAGVNLLLDWFAKSSAWDLYAQWGVKHYYLTAEVVQTVGLQGPVNYTSTLVMGGLTYEF